MVLIKGKKTAKALCTMNYTVVYSYSVCTIFPVHLNVFFRIARRDLTLFKQGWGT